MLKKERETQIASCWKGNIIWRDYFENSDTQYCNAFKRCIWNPKFYCLLFFSRMQKTLEFHAHVRLCIYTLEYLYKTSYRFIFFLLYGPVNELMNKFQCDSPTLIELVQKYKRNRYVKKMQLKISKYKKKRKIHKSTRNYWEENNRMWG